MRVVYSDRYELDLGAHVFPTIKFRLVRERLLKQGLVAEKDFLTPQEATREQLLLVHTKSYLDKLDKGTLSSQEIFTLELPYSRSLVEASRICVGGTILTAKFARQDGVSVHLGGGFHHAFADHGEGFCLLNDVACAAKFCRQQNIKKILILDCDLHQGNGNADIFKHSGDIFTFSIHQQNNYPAIKPASDLDVGLDDGVGDGEYLQALKKHLPKIFKDFRPELIFYIAGADPYIKDQLGGLSLSLDGLKRRDKFIFELVKENQAKVAVVFGGGYAAEINDTATIHYNTVRQALQVFA